MQHFGEKEGVYIIHTPLAVLDAVGKMKQQKLIEFAEPNYTYQHDVTSNDPYYTDGSLWGMYGDASTPANKFGSQAAEAWAGGHTGSSSVFVGDMGGILRTMITLHSMAPLMIMARMSQER